MNERDLNTLFAGFARTKVLVLGDVMLDAYLWGRVERISPEAPVPVVRVTDRSARLGGAANVALNLRALGADPLVVSTVGDDDDGRRLLRSFADEGLSPEGLLRSKARTTTVKTRVISGHQHIVRVDDEMDDDLALEDEDALLERIKRLIHAERPGVLVMEDYNKGVLTERVIGEAITLAQAAKVPVAVDPKKKNFFAYRGVDLFKPNLKELREGLKMDIAATDRAGLRTAMVELGRRMGNKTSLITLGEHGMCGHLEGRDHFVHAHTREITDVSGAGDTVIAVAALCLAQGCPLDTLMELANLAGGMVCEHVGVVPIDRGQFLSEAQRLRTPG